MARGYKGSHRRPGSKVRAHAVHRLKQYIGKEKGYSVRIGRKILLALRRASKKEGMTTCYITPENIKKGGADPELFTRYDIREDLYVVLGDDWSVMNVFQKKE